MSEPVRTTSRASNPQAWLAALFLLLAAGISGLTTLYWLVVLEPRLEADAHANASALAQSQAYNLSRALLAARDRERPGPLIEAMDEVLVLTESSTGLPFVLGLAVRVDDDALGTQAGLLDLDRGTECGHCFLARIPLYGPDSGELLGVADFRMSNVFLQRLKRDVRTKLVVGSALLLLLLLLTWRAVAALVRKVRAAQEAAEAATRAKSEFLANMSHEIRTPMNAILGTLRILNEEERDPAKQAQLDTVNTSARSLLRLLDDLLDLSKVEAGALTLRPQDFDLPTLLEEVTELMAYTAREKGLSFRTELSDDLPRHLRGDPVRVRQVLLNLIGNALKFTDTGGVSVQVYPHPSLRLAEDVIPVEFIVTDTGPGFYGDPQWLFEKFTQADTSSARRHGGSGLGLAISRRLVEAMGGRISAERVPEGGSTFRFWLPLTAVRKSVAEPVATQPPPEGARPRTLLLAEDNDLNRRVQRELLERAGHQVVEAADGDQAVAGVAEGGIDAVLMDLHMPGMDGLEATRAIRDLPEPAAARVPIIALTADVLPEEQERVLAAGMDGFVTKPLQPEVLDSELSRVLSERDGGLPPSGV